MGRIQTTFCATWLAGQSRWWIKYQNKFLSVLFFFFQSNFDIKIRYLIWYGPKLKLPALSKRRAASGLESCGSRADVKMGSKTLSMICKTYLNRNMSLLCHVLDARKDMIFYLNPILTHTYTQAHTRCCLFVTRFSTKPIQTERRKWTGHTKEKIPFELL